jgi:hypothetical protein
VATAEATGRVGGVQEQAAALNDTARREAAAERQVADEVVAARRDMAPPAAPAAAEARPVAQASAENEIRMQKVATDVWMTVGRSEAERILGHRLLTVPNLPIAAIEMAADTTTVRVRQDLGGGAALYLVQSRAAAPTAVVADAMAGAAAEPRERLARNAAPTVEGVVDGVRVVLSAPLSPDSLRVLLGTLR